MIALDLGFKAANGHLLQFKNRGVRSIPYALLGKMRPERIFSLIHVLEKNE